MLTLPIFNEQHVLRGFLALPLDLTVFDPDIPKSVQLEELRFGLVSDDGTLMWRNEDSSRMIGKNFKNHDTFRQTVAVKNGTFQAHNVDGADRHFAVEYLPLVRWYVFTSVPSKRIYANAFSRSKLEITIGLCSFLIFIYLVRRFARAIETPIQSLAATAKLIKEGAAVTRVEPAGPQEIVDVANEFNLMLEAQRVNAHSLHESERRYRTLTEISPVGIFQTNHKGDLLYANERWTEIAGLSFAESMGRGWLKAVHPEDVVRLMKCWEGSAAGLNQLAREFRFVRPDGTFRWVYGQIKADVDETGRVKGHIGTITDITERKESEEVIWRQANFDMLTGLPNRRMFTDRLSQEIKKSHRSSRQLALLFLDLDRFKEVNDTLGHDIGDILLKEAAMRLASCVRESDTVARLGGDEFTVILGELPDIDIVERTAQEILLKLAKPYVIGTERVYVTTSIGITIYPQDAGDIEVLVKNADQAMYAAKGLGRNRFSYFTSSMQEAAQRRLRLANDLRIALADNQFRVFFQPIIELGSLKIQKAEALIRWQHPTRGLVSPAEFIPIAEETGMIGDICCWVFQEISGQAIRLRDVHSQNIQISINRSPVQFHGQNNDHVSWPEHLHKLGLPAGSVAIEITEGALMDANDTVREHLRAFRAAGIQVSLDDFGTGYSALSYLNKFEIDYLKIDQSFVRDLTIDTQDKALCEAIIVMAHKLGIRVIAEGVETEVQRDLLLAAGCDYAQGYLYSRPLPAAEFEEFLAKWKSAS